MNLNLRSEVCPCTSISLSNKRSISLVDDEIAKNPVWSFSTEHFSVGQVTELHLLAQQAIQLLTTVEKGGFGI